MFCQHLAVFLWAFAYAQSIIFCGVELIYFGSVLARSFSETMETFKHLQMQWHLSQ